MARTRRSVAGLGCCSRTGNALSLTLGYEFALQSALQVSKKRVRAQRPAMNQLASISDGPMIDRGVAPAAAQAKTREHIAYIEYFRALAILMIACGHIFSAGDGLHFADRRRSHHPGSPLITRRCRRLINSGTAYFVFISGFLYRQVFYGRTPYGEFMRKQGALCRPALSDAWRRRWRWPRCCSVASP